MSGKILVSPTRRRPPSNESFPHSLGRHGPRRYGGVPLRQPASLPTRALPPKSDRID